MTAPDAGPQRPAEDPAHSPTGEPAGGPGHNVHALLLALKGQWAEASSRLQKLEDKADALEHLLDRVADLESTATTAAGPALRTPEPPHPGDEVPENGAEPEPFDPRRLVGWVRENVVQVMERGISTQATSAPYWCRRWWEHPEAIVRFEAAHRSWSAAVTQADGDAMSTYLQHLDHHLAVLMGPSGPFSRCKPGKHYEQASCLGQDEPDETFYAADHDSLTSAPDAAGLGGPVHPTPYPRGNPASNGAGPSRGVDQHRVPRGKGW